MRYPKLNAPQTIRHTLTRFGGYDRSPNPPADSLWESENLCADAAPHLAPRAPRGTVPSAPRRLRGMCAVSLPEGETLCMADGESGDLILGASRYPLGLSDTDKQMIPFGAWVIILPDLKYFRPREGTWGDLNATATAPGATYTLCRPDGSPYLPLSVGELPAEPQNGDFWLDTAHAAPILYRYDIERLGWRQVEDTCVRVSARGIGAPFRAGDGVRLSGIAPAELRALNGTHRIIGRGEDHLILRGMVRESLRQTAPITVSRRIPPLNFLVAAGNRLWGCFCGEYEGEFFDCIRASRAGDPFNWESAAGEGGEAPLHAEVGVGGQFTGAALLGGAPCFSKEDCLISAEESGSGAGGVRLRRLSCPGASEGNHRSLCAVGGSLYYLARGGLARFDGKVADDLSAPFGDLLPRRAVSCALGGTLYLALTAADGSHQLFVYDTERRLLYRSGSIRVTHLCACGGELYFFDGDRQLLRTVRGTGIPDAAPVRWMAQTHYFNARLGGTLTPLRLSIALAAPLSDDAALSLDIDYGDNEWRYLDTLRGGAGDTLDLVFPLPHPPHRSSRFRLRLRGTGYAQVSALEIVSRE